MTFIWWKTLSAAWPGTGRRDETKTILGYTAKKQPLKQPVLIAVRPGTVKRSRWFLGPEQFNGLPGMILGLDATRANDTAKALDKKIDQEFESTC